jgi:hypothetical protein
MCCLQISDLGSDGAHFGSTFFVAEMKGGKHHTKAHGAPAEDCLPLCFEDFLTEFSALHWDYMVAPEHGTLLIDIGITHHPIHPTPLVGLWRLDSLEASFGAAGFTAGSLHNLNTLSLYGGLQAEMRAKHMQRSQVVFRSSYNLAYEVTRRLDNGRDLFVDKDAYVLHEDYLWNAEQVASIYTVDAANKSFGVRDEFRMGGRAMSHILDHLDDQVCLISIAKHQLTLLSRLMKPCFHSLSSGFHPMFGSTFLPNESQPSAMSSTICILSIPPIMAS